MTLVVSAASKYGLKCEDCSPGMGPNLFVLFLARGGVGVEMASLTGEFGDVGCRTALGGVGSGRGSVGSSS